MRRVVGGAGGGAPVGGGGVRAGQVVQFDEAVGLGEVAPADGGPPLPFHCTQIAGGTRTIDVGTEVTFTVVAGHLGRWEAARVAPVEA